MDLSSVEPVFDDEGNSHDFVMLDFNKVWEDQTGLNAADYLGKTITEAMPDVEPIWISNFAEVCKTDEPIHFESYNKGLINGLIYMHSPSKSDRLEFFLMIYQSVKELKKLLKTLKII